jgi:hypothetical protein
MHSLLFPVLANLVYIGSGAGLLLLIIVIVLILK